MDNECGYDDRPPHDSRRVEGVHRNKWPGSFDSVAPEIYRRLHKPPVLQHGRRLGCISKIYFT